jgi:hypothetical protein
MTTTIGRQPFRDALIRALLKHLASANPVLQGGGARQRGVPRERPMRDAMRLEKALLEQGIPCEAPIGSLRYIARQQLIRDRASRLKKAEKILKRALRSRQGVKPEKPAIEKSRRRASTLRDGSPTMRKSE